LKQLASFSLTEKDANQQVNVEPFEGKFLKVVIRSNWGHPWYTQLGFFHAVDNKKQQDSLVSDLRAHGKIDLYGLYFDTDSAALRAESESTIQQLVELINQFPEQQFVVEGHTDNTGATDHNQQLSLARAQAVVVALTNHGVQQSQLQAQGFGVSQPVESNQTEQGKAKNRRVTLRLK